MVKKSILIALLSSSLAAPVYGGIEDLVGQNMPDVSALNHENTLKSLSEYQGKVVLLHICAVWCQPCQQFSDAHESMVEELNTRIGESKYIFVDLLHQSNTLGGVSTLSDAVSWHNTFNPTTDVWHLDGDPNANVTNLIQFVFGTVEEPSYPTNLILDPDGVVAYASTSWDPDKVSMIVDTISSLAQNNGIPYRSVQINIKPNDDENRVLRKNADVIKIAILSSDSFNAPAEIDRSTVTLAGAAVQLIGYSDYPFCKNRDVNEDGLIDLLCKIQTQPLLLRNGSSQAIFEADTYEGERIRGEDQVFVKGKPFGS